MQLLEFFTNFKPFLVKKHAIFYISQFNVNTAFLIFIIVIRTGSGAAPWLFTGSIMNRLHLINGRYATIVTTVVFHIWISWGTWVVAFMIVVTGIFVTFSNNPCLLGHAKQHQQQLGSIYTHPTQLLYQDECGHKSMQQYLETPLLQPIHHIQGHPSHKYW